MFKFIHKKHLHFNPKTSKIVIYYNIPDIVLGILFTGLTVFFVYNYLSDSFHWATQDNFHPIGTNTLTPLTPISTDEKK